MVDWQSPHTLALDGRTCVCSLFISSSIDSVYHVTVAELKVIHLIVGVYVCVSRDKHLLSLPLIISQMGLASRDSL